jgi:hypothetical protein
MAQETNIGTLISTTIRPFYTDDVYPSVLSNDMMGGIHLIESRNSGGGFDQIISLRRQWGMLAFVLDEQKYYRLTPLNPPAAPDLSRNANWIEFSGGSGGSSEWIDSVKAVYGDSGLISPDPITGDRYLVGSLGFGDFIGYENNIAVYNSSLGNFDGGYIFTQPTNGSTLRVDNQPDVLYKFPA